MPNGTPYRCDVITWYVTTIHLNVAVALRWSDASKFRQRLSDNSRSCPRHGAQLCTDKGWMVILTLILVVGKSCMSTWTHVKYGNHFGLGLCVAICQSADAGNWGLEAHLLVGFANIVHRMRSETRCTWFMTRQYSTAEQAIREHYAHLFASSASTMNHTFATGWYIISVTRFVVACLDVLGQAKGSCTFDGNTRYL